MLANLRFMNGLINNSPEGLHFEPVLDFEQSRLLDKITIDSGFSEMQLMGQAALASAVDLLGRYRINSSTDILILTGPGNNGGDGFAMAYHLNSHIPGIRIRIVSVGLDRIRSEAAKHYLSLIQDSTVELFDYREAPNELDTLLKKSHIIIDALLGSGQYGSLREPYKTILSKLNEIKGNSNTVLISLDIPTGLTEDKGFSAESCIPDEIHNYGPGKMATLLSADLAGHARIKNLPAGFISIDKTQIQSTYFQSKLTDQRAFLSFIKQSGFHKYTAGYGLLIGGSKSMSGALHLAAECFFAAGGGILQTLQPANSTMVSSSLASVMSEELNTETLSRWLKPESKKPDCIVAGPGLSETDLQKNRESLIDFLDRLDCPVVLDASACKLAVDSNSARLANKTLKRCILTPHAGEWTRMGGCSHTTTDNLKNSRNAYLELFSGSEFPLVLVKSSISILHSKEASIIVSCPEAALATAGSGDCLTGIMMSILARKQKQFDSIPSTLLSLWLLIESVKKNIHPSSNQFADLIRKLLFRIKKDEVLL